MDPWQEAVLQAAMGERGDGTWAAKQVGLSAPRQNGKSQLIVARALAGALLFGERKIVISAHAQDTARETFAKFIEQIDASAALAERIDKVMNALNREFIKFKNGAVVQFKARTVSGSRGFSSDCLLLDEAQILGMPAWVSINSTMSARPNPQIWLMGTPPTPEDNGEVFTSIRNAALKGRSQTLAWLEWSAGPDDDPALESTRAAANPAWHTRINHEIVQGEFETYPPDRFALDRLGRWDDGAGGAAAIPWELWSTLGDSSAARGAPTFGVAVAPDRSWSAVAAAWRRSDGKAQVCLTEGGYRPDATWIVDHVAALQQRAGGVASVLVDAAARGLIPNAVEPSQAEQAQADNALADAVLAATIRHGDDPAVDMAVRNARWRSSGDTRILDRKGAKDISPLRAVALALRGLEQGRSVYEDREMRFLG